MYKVLALTVIAAAQVAFTSVSIGESHSYVINIPEFIKECTIEHNHV